jgi:molybdate transport system substrate-binding protein
MLSRIHPAWVAFGGSLLLFLALLGVLYWGPFSAETSHGGEPLLVYCGEALRGPMEPIAREYEAEHGQKVFLHFGPSQTILANLTVTQKGDLFLPTDDSYLDLAVEKQLIRDTTPLARMTAVMIVHPKFAYEIKSWADLVKLDSQVAKLAIGNPDTTAIGKLLRERMTKLGLWQELTQRRAEYMVNVNEVANAVQLGSIQVGIVWDVVAKLQGAKVRVIRRACRSV